MNKIVISECVSWEWAHILHTLHILQNHYCMKLNNSYSPVLRNKVEMCILQLKTLEFCLILLILTSTQNIHSLSFLRHAIFNNFKQLNWLEALTPWRPHVDCLYFCKSQLAPAIPSTKATSISYSHFLRTNVFVATMIMCTAWCFNQSQEVSTGRQDQQMSSAFIKTDYTPRWWCDLTFDVNHGSKNITEFRLKLVSRKSPNRKVIVARVERLRIIVRLVTAG